MPKNVLIVDDHPIYREGLKTIVSSLTPLQITGEAENGKVAVHKARQLKPDLILMDLVMPVMNGTEAIRLIKQRNPDIRIIALTEQKSHEYVQATMAAGANGYLLKDESTTSILSAIECVMNGQFYLSSGVCDKVVSGFLGNTSNCQHRDSWTNLTLREREVIKLVAEGYKNREIAAHLSLSIKTVEKHRSSLMKKLDIRGVSALTTYAIENSLVAI